LSALIFPSVSGYNIDVPASTPALLSVSNYNILNLPMAKAWLKPGGSKNFIPLPSAALAFATTSAASHWIIFFFNGRSALRDMPWKKRKAFSFADSLFFQHRPSFESGSALGASFPARMLGVRLKYK